MGKLKESLGHAGCTLNVHSLTDEQKKSIVLVNNDLEESLKQFMDHHCSLSFKALREFLSKYDSDYPSKLDFINHISKELQIRKLESEQTVNELIENNWLMYLNVY